MNLPNNVVVIVRTLNDVDQIDQRSDDTTPTEIPVSQPIYRSNSSVDFIRDNFLLKIKG